MQSKLMKLTHLTALATAAAVLAACGGTATEPQTYTAANGEEFNDADVTFATDMIQHHAQALAMVDLTTGRTLDPEVQRLAEDIREAQAPEIEQMVDWLNDWDRPVPTTVRDHGSEHGGDHSGADSGMPGMMSAEEMTALDSASGAVFQQQWLEAMIEHHEGAVEMARTEQADGLFPPAVQLARTIESAQKEEIATMQGLLDQ